MLNEAQSSSSYTTRSRTLTPNQRSSLPILGRVPVVCMQREIATVFRDSGVYPTNGFRVRKVIAHRRQVDEMDACSLIIFIRMRMAINNGFHLLVRRQQAEQPVAIQERIIAIVNRVMDENQRGCLIRRAKESV